MDTWRERQSALPVSAPPTKNEDEAQSSDDVPVPNIYEDVAPPAHSTLDVPLAIGLGAPFLPQVAVAPVLNQVLDANHYPHQYQMHSAPVGGFTIPYPQQHQMRYYASAPAGIQPSFTIPYPQQHQMRYYASAPVPQQHQMRYHASTPQQSFTILYSQQHQQHNLYQMTNYASASVGMQQSFQMTCPSAPARMQESSPYYPTELPDDSYSSSSSHQHAPWRRQLRQDYALAGPGQALDSSSSGASSGASRTFCVAGQTPHSALASKLQVIDVWEDNANTVCSQISRLIEGGDRLVIVIDSEFAIPDNCRVHDGEPPNPEEFYSQLQGMVNGGDIIQFGLLLATHADLLGIWQFNLHFSPAWRAADHPGINFLRKNAAIDFHQHERRGIPRAVFASWFSESGLLHNSNADWISFGGCNDFGLLLHYRQQFLKTFRDFFPRSYDLRIFTKLGRCRTQVIHGSLSIVCQRLQVNIPGKAHNSGYDALCTFLCFVKMSGADPLFMKKITQYCGAVYGISDIDEFDRQYH